MCFVDGSGSDGSDVFVATDKKNKAQAMFLFKKNREGKKDTNTQGPRAVSSFLA